jgi:hypothetical protein
MINAMLLAVTAVTATGTDRTSMAPGFGAAIAVVGDEILVGRARATAAPPQSVGAVHVFRSNGPGWTEVGSFAAQETALGDGFGSALAGAGNLVAVGAPLAALGAGAVYLFARGADGRWISSVPRSTWRAMS